MSLPSPERVAEIASMDDRPVIRNLLITQSYHQFTLGMADLYGRDHLIWPVFATWASKQAGAFIRGDALMGPIGPILDRVPRSAPGRASLVALVERIVADISRHIVGGNTIVFDELGGMFARFHQTFADPAARTEAGLAELVARYAEGPSVADTIARAADGSLVRTSHGGQSLIREALGIYFAAFHTRDRNARAELILLGNALCGLHEQTRLQPYILGALDSPLEVLIDDVDDALQPIARQVAALIRRAATEVVMTMAVPGQVIRLGSDLPAAPGRPLWPEDLIHLEHPRLLELAAQVGAYEARERRVGALDRIEDWLQGVLARVDVGAREAQGSGAADWASLQDRMGFIFEFFRSRQCDDRLLTPPFTEVQLVALVAGDLPIGPL